MNRLRQLGLFLLAVFVHIESLTYWFVAIDTPKLIVSSRVGSAGDVVELFTRPMMHGTGFADIALFYRPLSSLSYAFDYWLWGLTPAGYHLTNLVLHGIVTVLIGIAVAEITDNSVVGQLSAVLFALHPLTAEVVPAAARRHDIIMAIFMLGSLTLFIRHAKERKRKREREQVQAPILARAKTRIQGAHRLGGALVLYAIALGAKEPALILPGLVFVWTVIQRFETPITALRAAVRDVIPFGVVTLAYLAVRFAVLGELGGYHRSGSVTLEDVIRVAVEYVISLLYPSSVIDTGLSTGGRWVAVPIVLIVLIVLVSLCGVRSLSMNRSRLASMPLFAGFIGGCAALVLLIAAQPLGKGLLESLVYLQPGAHHSYLYPSPAHATIGLTLLGSCLAGVLWALISRTSILTATTTKALVFFLVWFLAPLAMFFRSGLYTIRTGYLSIIPTMAILSVLLVSAGQEIRTRNTIPLDQNTAIVGIMLLLIVPMVATSPLIHPYDEWKEAGEVNRLTLQGLDDELNGTDETTVKVVGLPIGIAASEQPFPRVKSIVYLSPKAAQSWLRLQHPQDTSSGITVVNGGGRIKLQHVPDRVEFDSTRNHGTVTVRLRYETNAKRNNSGMSHTDRRIGYTSRVR